MLWSIIMGKTRLLSSPTLCGDGWKIGQSWEVLWVKEVFSHSSWSHAHIHKHTQWKYRLRFKSKRILLWKYEKDTYVLRIWTLCLGITVPVSEETWSPRHIASYSLVFVSLSFVFIKKSYIGSDFLITLNWNSKPLALQVRPQGQSLLPPNIMKRIKGKMCDVMQPGLEPRTSGSLCKHLNNSATGQTRHNKSVILLGVHTGVQEQIMALQGHWY